MSRSNLDNENEFGPSGPRNPCERWFQWNGSTGQLTWYDRDQKANHLVALPFRFLVLDQLNTITGYSEHYQTGFWSTEVYRTSDTMILNPRGRSGECLAAGTWKELAEFKGAKFTKSVYIAFYDADSDLRLGNIKFAGSALGGLSDWAITQNFEAHRKNKNVKLYEDPFLNTVGWFNFTGTTPDLLQIGVELTGNVADRKGAVNFFRPIFRPIQKVSDESNEMALELDKILQTYLTAYFKKPVAEIESAPIVVVDQPDEPILPEPEPPNRSNPYAVPIADTPAVPLTKDEIPF